MRGDIALPDEKEEVGKKRYGLEIIQVDEEKFSSERCDGENDGGYAKKRGKMQLDLPAAFLYQ